MKRYPPHDPPEYVEWTAEPEVIDAYIAKIDENERLAATAKALDEAKLRAIYETLVRSRLYDITLKRWVRTGVLTKAWLGVGEEATTAGALHAIAPDDPVGPMIRNQAAAFEKGIPLDDCFRVYLATGDTITKGRDLHIGDLSKHCISPISHVADLVPVLCGFALAFKTRGEERVALNWCGEGATRTGAFHEGMALAAGLDLPLITIIQDNQVALGTRKSDRLERALRGTAAGHGIPGLECDGNHVLDVLDTVAEARRICLAGEGPVIVYARTFRMGGHATHDEREARDLFAAELFREWGQRDPIACYEEYLVRERGISRESLETWESAVNDEIEAAAERALASRESSPPDPALMLGDVLG